MANLDHLSMLETGVEAWNQWIYVNPRRHLDLSEANLSKKNLEGILLRKANLFKVNLSGSSLVGANLREANLSRANLGEVDLSKADLREADLSGANLSQANLSQANLNRANLRNADLSKATILKADFREARLSKANLSEVDFRKSNLREADISEAVLFKANLRKANLSKANLIEATLGGANLYRANIREAQLREAKLFRAVLRKANLSEVDLRKSDLTGADLSDARLTGANLRGANLTGANLAGANLSGADLSGANLREADLSGADLSYVRLIEVDLEESNISNCFIYGLSVWDVKLDGASQSNLIITPEHDSAITVDNLDVAQFIYLLLNNQKIRHVINVITSKVVLILGRFTPQRKDILDALREELRKHDYLPIVFDFDPPSSRNLTETISILAHMSRFIIADITDAKSIPQELQAIVPHLPSLPVQPLVLSSEVEYGMFQDFKDYPWVLQAFHYDNLEELLKSLQDKVIGPAATMAKDIEGRRKSLDQDHG